MAATAQQIADLEAAIASGALTVQYGDPPRRVTYRSLAEMESVLAKLKGELSGSTSGRSTFAGFQSG